MICTVKTRWVAGLKIVGAMAVVAFMFVQITRGQGTPAMVLTQHNDNSRTGANLNETALNTSNVNAGQFGKLFSRAVDGQTYAQPLYVPGVNMGSRGIHNVVFVATEKNNVYAFDADDPAASAALWQVNLGPPVPVRFIDETVDINEYIGITSTPVIDPVTKTLYCVAKTREGGRYPQRLHALDIATGQERFGGPIVIDASVPGAGDGTKNGTVAFNSQRHMNRPGLLLQDGYLYVAFGSHGDVRPYHGWILSYNASTLQRVGVFNTTPNTFGGAVWQSGQGLAADGTGVYFMTANGHFDGDIGGPDLSSSFLKLTTPSLTLMDWFAPYNADALDGNNEDLASAGPLMIPGTNLLVGGGKEGVLYLLNRSNMGHFRAGSDSQIVQSFHAGGGHIHGSPVYWNSPQLGPLIYLWTEEDALKSFRFVNGLFQTAPVAIGPVIAPDGMPGAMLSVSANGSTTGTGIVWASLPFSGNANIETVPGVLRALDASNVGIELWNSRQVPERDDLGNLAKHTPPTVANGRVYVATFSNQLVVYGLNPPGGGTSPLVSSLSPTSGSTAGGTAVTITGANFASGATVTFGGVAASGVSVANSSTITATTPAHAAGSVDVTVTNPGSSSGTLNSGFTYVNPTAPAVTSVTPNSGPTGGGTTVTIGGANFVSGATVTFGGAPATGVSVSSSTSMTAVTPAHSAGPVTVTVTNPDLQSASLTAGFAYVNPTGPTVTSVTPNSGPTGGGTPVTISGSNFVSGATVTFGGTPASGVSVSSSTSMTAVTPGHSAGSVTVTVTNPDLQSASLTGGFTYGTPAAISFIQVAAAVPQSSPSTVPISYGSPQTAGDLNVVVVGWNNSTSTVQSIQDSAGNTYALAIGPTTGTSLRQSIYYASNIKGGSNTVTVTFNQATAFPDIRILQYRGVTTLDVVAGASGSGTTANSGSATTTAANELIVGANMVSSITTGPGSGFTTRIITSPDSDIVEDRVVTSTGSYSATSPLTSGAWVMQMVTFK